MLQFSSFIPVLYRLPVNSGTSAPPGTRKSAVTDAVGLAPSLLPRPSAVAITVKTTALDRVSGVVCAATRASRGSGVVWRVSLWVGLVLRLVCEVLVSVSCVSRLPPVSLNRTVPELYDRSASKRPRRRKYLTLF